MGAFASLASKSKKRERSALIPATFLSRVASSRRFLSSDFPEGSPIIPVAPPTKAMGRCPKFRKCFKMIMGTRLPIWRESAVGSKPIYTVVASFTNCCSVPGIMSWTRPLHCNSCTKFFIFLTCLRTKIRIHGAILK